MSRLDDLPPDQRAVLMLLVAQGKSHAEIATMLGIPQDTVRDRARRALDALAAGPGETRGRAPASAPLAPAGAGPHAIPSAGSSRPSSRRGGALLLVALVVAVVVAVILITSGGSSHKSSTTQAGATASSTTSTSQKTGTPTVKQIALTSPEPGSKRVGLVEVFSEGTKHGYYIAVEHLPATNGFFYAVWLYNSPASALPLSKSPPVTSNGRLKGGALLPATAGSYHKILLTRETSTKPSHPGPIVLSGSFSLP
ncbi:MAG TPA: sigma factor-like helix-turn-helix DNA-binding protein [Solirubrobacteraceae bacterium]|nr:sigma factor-like helix-turn-helix DNA-binding protein [Solirubrobacteraceae bacterium]